MNPNQPYYGQATGGGAPPPGYPAGQQQYPPGPGAPSYQGAPAQPGQAPYGQGQYGQPQGQPPQGQPPYQQQNQQSYGQNQGYQPPPGQGQYGQPPHGQPPHGQPPHGQPPHGQPPYQQGQPPHGQPPQGQYPPQGQPPQGYNQYNQPLPGQQQYSQPPQGQGYQNQPPPAHGQYPPQGQPPQGYYPPQQGQPGQQQQYQQYPQQGQGQPQYPPQGQNPGYGAPNQYGAPQQQWQQQQQIVPPTPASPGYDPAQKILADQVKVNTTSDIETLRKAMKGMGCDEAALIRVLTSSKYRNPWAMAQLVQDYHTRFMRDLSADIKSETRGDFETGLLALIRNPLHNDALILEGALIGVGTDEEALNDVLLCRSNADIRAIIAEFRRIRAREYENKELLPVIEKDVNATLFRLYQMVLSAKRTEHATPVDAADIDRKVDELHRATEGIIGANSISVAQIFTSSNDSQLAALSEAYKRKYHRSLQDVIEKEFRGDMEDALLRMLLQGKDRAATDALRLRAPLEKTFRKDRLFINRLVSLYWDPIRLQAAKDAYKRLYAVSFHDDVKNKLSGDYEGLMLALIGGK